jgi:hypothetical protein
MTTALLVLLDLLILSAPMTGTAQVQSLVASNTAFALKLYSQLATNSGNLFFSPYSISTCLAMLYAGASGNTEQQKCTNLVRFSGFLVLLSRFVVVVQGIMPARGWIQDGGFEGAPTSPPSVQTQDFPMCVGPFSGAHPLLTSWLVKHLIVGGRDIDERDRPKITSG